MSCVVSVLRCCRSPSALSTIAQTTAPTFALGAVQRFSLLGSTGSIGTQTLDIVREQPDRFEIVALAAGGNLDLLADQARRTDAPTTPSS